jgi:two-component system, NtrC family, C4-dicarboxylate transport sensor histidine kinase DctB
MDTLAGDKRRWAFLGRISAKQWVSLFRIVLILIAFAGVMITNYWVDKVRQGVIKDSEAAMQSVSVNLTADLNDLEMADDILAGLPWVAAVLESGKSQEVMKANDSLQHFNKERGMTVCYIMDRSGMTVASSNFSAPDSFIGKNYGFRKYFSQAIRGISSKDFAIGMTSLKKGVYAGSPVRDDYNRVIGVAVVKKDLERMGDLLKQYHPSFFVDHLGVILSSSDPGLSMKSLWPLDKKVLQNGNASKHSGDNGISASLMPRELKNGMEVEFRGGTFFVNRQFIGEEGWSIIVLASLKDVKFYRMAGLILTTLTLGFLVLTYLFIHWWQTVRRKMVDVSNTGYKTS